MFALTTEATNPRQSGGSANGWTVRALSKSKPFTANLARGVSRHMLGGINTHKRQDTHECAREAMPQVQAHHPQVINLAAFPFAKSEQT